MSKAQRKAKMIKLAVAGDHRVITKDDVAQRAYELFLARGQGEGQDVEDWLEAERQLEAESMGPLQLNRQSRETLQPAAVRRMIISSLETEYQERKNTLQDAGAMI